MLRAIDPRLREAAADARRVTRAGLARGRPARSSPAPLLVAAGFAFAVSLGEFGATSFIVRPDHADAAGRRSTGCSGSPAPLNFGGAMAASVILMALTALAILGIERFRVGRWASF